MYVHSACDCRPCAQGGARQEQGVLRTSTLAWKRSRFICCSFTVVRQRLSSASSSTICRRSLLRRSSAPRSLASSLLSCSRMFLTPTALLNALKIVSLRLFTLFSSVAACSRASRLSTRPRAPDDERGWQQGSHLARRLLERSREAVKLGLLLSKRSDDIPQARVQLGTCRLCRLCRSPLAVQGHASALDVALQLPLLDMLVVLVGHCVEAPLLLRALLLQPLGVRLIKLRCAIMKAPAYSMRCDSVVLLVYGMPAQAGAGSAPRGAATDAAIDRDEGALPVRDLEAALSVELLGLRLTAGHQRVAHGVQNRGLDLR